ncbi:MAG: methionine--tRNA ligase [Candidatus Paceibacterota bacterium]|jgi:methionyl-tRNA synthetase
MDLKRFYITTTLPYVNAAPHVGFALEIVQADAIARFRRKAGEEVFFNTGTDEHGLKIYQKAIEEKKTPQEYCDEYAAKFGLLREKLALSYNNFIRTTDPHHIKAAQEFWKRCEATGDIYKTNYKAKYCVGCELEKTDSELVNGRCPIHPNKDLEMIEEENYFFRFSKYQKPLLDLYDANPEFVVPATRQNEISSFVKGGLQDFSVSRLKSKMPWGIPVPGDEDHVMYVWFDALVNYISCLGWPASAEIFGGAESFFEEFWGTKEDRNAIQVAGKDNLRQQTAMWQAMLMSAGLPNSKQVFIHGYITSNGQKMSKSLGNVVDPIALVDKYGTDAVRYYLLREVPGWDDGDFSKEKFEQRYNADLAGGLGNLLARTLAMAGKLGAQEEISDRELKAAINVAEERSSKEINSYKFNEALMVIWDLVAFCNKIVEREKPWEQGTEDLADKNRKVVGNLLFALEKIGEMIEPFLPGTSLAIAGQLESKTSSPLFPRING